MKLKALIVDDEYPAREELRYYLKKIGDVDVVGEAASGDEALALINALDYDIIFLDINFPASDGIEIGKKIVEMDSPPSVIYITAYEQYAYKAFEVNAVDYILKPIEEEKLRKAVNKAKALKEGVSHKKEPEKSTEPISRISVENKGKIILLNNNDIYFAYSENNYIFVKTKNEKYITKYTLSSLEKKLDPRMFFRAHRSYVVNLSKIKEISPFFKGTFNIIMSDADESEIPVSRRQAKDLKKLLDL